MMATLAAIWTWITGWFTGLFRPRYRLEEVHGAFPPRLRRLTLYVLKEDGTPWQAAMICPCGCGATLEMNLLPDERPMWRYDVSAKGFPSLKPSVWRQVGCRSHFFLRSGQIIWVRDGQHSGSSGC